MSRQSFVLLVSGLLVAGLFAVPAGATSSAPEIESAVAFTDSDGQFTRGHVFVEVRFDQAINNSTVSTTDIAVKRSDSWQSPSAVRPGAQPDDRQLLLDLGPATKRLRPTTVSAIALTGEIETTDGTAFAGSEIRNASVTSTSTTLTEGATDRTAFRGETVAVIGDQAGEDLTVRPRVGHDIVRMGPLPDDGQVYALNTTGFAADRYTAAFDGNRTAAPTGGDRSLELWNFSLDLQVTPNPNVDDATITDVENLTGTIETNAAGEGLLLMVSDGDETLSRTQLSTGGNGDASFELDPIELDEADDHFFVTAVHTISGRSDTERIKVSQVDYDTGFAKSHLVQHRGDVVDIPVRLSPTVGDKVAVDQATVTIGSPAAGYQANLTIGDWNDDQEVLIHWNTYAADGPGDNTEFWVEPTDPERRDDTLTVEDISTVVSGPPGDVLDAGEYEVTVRHGADEAGIEADATMPVWLTERSTDGIEIYTAPTGEDRSLEDLESLREGRAEGWVTPAATLTRGDRAIIAIRASGIQGGIETGPDPDTGLTFSQFLQDGVALNTTQLDPGPNRAGVAVNLSAGTDRVLVNESAETYYALVSLSATDPARDTDGDGTVDPGEPAAELAAEDRFNTTFDIPETDGGLAETDEQVSAHWTYEEPDATVRTERATPVAPRPNQSIAGTTTIAPGSTVELRVRSEHRSVAFFRTATATVDRNRTWETALNMTGVPNGTELSITVVHDSETLATATGLVRTVQRTTEEPIRATQPPTTPRPATTEASTEPPPTTAAPTPTEPDPVTTATPDPGTTVGTAPLGPVVSLGVLVGLLLGVRYRKP